MQTLPRLNNKLIIYVTKSPSEGSRNRKSICFSYSRILHHKDIDRKAI
jgi:hypothetical protein